MYPDNTTRYFVYPAAYLYLPVIYHDKGWPNGVKNSTFHILCEENLTKTDTQPEREIQCIKYKNIKPFKYIKIFHFIQKYSCH